MSLRKSRRARFRNETGRKAGLIWNVGFGIWNVGFGIWNVGFGIWNVGFGIYDFRFVILNC